MAVQCSLYQPSRIRERSPMASLMGYLQMPPATLDTWPTYRRSPHKQPCSAPCGSELPSTPTLACLVLWPLLLIVAPPKYGSAAPSSVPLSSSLSSCRHLAHFYLSHFFFSSYVHVACSQSVSGKSRVGSILRIFTVFPFVLSF